MVNAIKLSNNKICNNNRVKKIEKRNITLINNPHKSIQIVTIRVCPSKTQLYRVWSNSIIKTYQVN